jgi:hypothetical protein
MCIISQWNLYHLTMIKDSWPKWIELLHTVWVSLYILVVSLVDIAAYPDSVNVLSNIQNDIRTPDKLIDGVNGATDGRHTWLAPILPTIVSMTDGWHMWLAPILPTIVISNCTAHIEFWKFYESKLNCHFLSDDGKGSETMNFSRGESLYK